MTVGHVHLYVGLRLNLTLGFYYVLRLSFTLGFYYVLYGIHQTGFWTNALAVRS